MMRRDLNDGADTRAYQHYVSDTARRLRRSRARAKVRSVRGPATNNVLASFGMIVGLLMIWAMTVSL